MNRAAQVLAKYGTMLIGSKTGRKAGREGTWLTIDAQVETELHVQWMKYAGNEWKGKFTWFINIMQSIYKEKKEVFYYFIIL